MNEPGPVSAAAEGPSGPVFISYATADRKDALAVCKAIERRGVKCWVSCRDVAPGENYQEAIVRALRGAPAMALVFSKAANNSDEIKKELSLASRYRVPVIALRIEDVEPSDAFAYELSTRQWIDAFDGWDRSIDSVVRRIAEISQDQPVAAASPPTARSSAWSGGRSMTIAMAAVLLLAIAAGAWLLLRSPRAAAHSMTLRLAGFQVLSPDLPATMHDAVGAEIIAAFNADGVIGVSTAAAPPSGKEPAYTLGGTINRIGDSIRVITRFTNERSGAILWSNSVDYSADQIARAPHKIAADVGTVIRCGLFGASTYRKRLPDPVLSNYMKYCEQSWAYGASKTLLFAQRVVAALPDFSWGWSAVQTGYMQASYAENDDKRVEEMRAAGLQAADKALALDPRNSEALDRKTYLIDPLDWTRQESLYKSAIAAKPLDCGCEHYGYGLMLRKVGRLREAIDQFQAATDMLALWPDSQRALADTLVAADRVDEAKPHFDTAIDLSKDSAMAQRIAVSEGTDTGDHGAALTVLRNPQAPITEETRAPLIAGYEALASRNDQTKAKAIRALIALPAKLQDDRVAVMLAALGANREALRAAIQNPALFWRKSMRAILYEPDFPAVANRLRLIPYWKASHLRPDVCSDKDPPPFCRMI